MAFHSFRCYEIRKPDESRGERSSDEKLPVPQRLKVDKVDVGAVGNSESARKKNVKSYWRDKRSRDFRINRLYWELIDQDLPSRPPLPPSL